ncbi:hypothetical protein BO78DRAFT_18169 [Aspergillus sclerotiicarbonarius CBS 121057]|uniref:Uncharacterized protein n=1 Tax=Aspergillus sclerotiicarbonarius (strain CBS 121057 / IBT 28362) TaxID=1448318 RepID=A0A319DUA0_ASPSB|nr:hypothetical protein BO78DRAFT_18169 [Aspergillus sclerotiicarbonarius CBS 121057]
MLPVTPQNRMTVALSFFNGSGVCHGSEIRRGGSMEGVGSQPCNNILPRLNGSPDIYHQYPRYSAAGHGIQLSPTLER